MSDEKFSNPAALRGSINCGNVKLNLDKLTFSLSCIYCDLEMLSIKDFGYHFQEHLVMSKAENEVLLKNLERTIPLLIEDQTKTKESEYEIEMLEDTTEDPGSPTNTPNDVQNQFVFQVIENDSISELNKSTDLQQPLDEQETVDMGFDLLPDDEVVPIAIKARNDSFTCDVCDFKFADAATLRKHRAHHNRCQVCKKCFPSKVELRAHMSKHRQNRVTYECSECGQFFPTTFDLSVHHESHVQKMLHLCNTCGKSFQDERILRQHIDTHTSSRPFVCMECNMTFSKNHALMLHTKLHSDVRKFSCSICRMTFAQNSGLINHLRDRHSNTVAKEA